MSGKSLREARVQQNRETKGITATKGNRSSILSIQLMGSNLKNNRMLVQRQKVWQVQARPSANRFSSGAHNRVLRCTTQWPQLCILGWRLDSSGLGSQQWNKNKAIQPKRASDRVVESWQLQLEPTKGGIWSINTQATAPSVRAWTVWSDSMQSQSNVGWIQYNNMPVRCIAGSVIPHNRQIRRWRQLKTYLNSMPREPNYLGLHLARGCHISQGTRVINSASTLNCSLELEAIVGQISYGYLPKEAFDTSNLRAWHLWPEPVSIEQFSTESVMDRVNDMQR